MQRESIMKTFKLAVASAMLALAAGPALAQHLLPSFVYRTGPYAPSGIPFADGVSDYYTLVNERDLPADPQGHRG
jgi:branched-chain amino acid transport system substrate-binding protein